MLSRTHIETQGRAGHGSIGVVRSLRSLSSCAGPVIMAVALDYVRNFTSEFDSGSEFENTLSYDICRGKRSL